MYSADPYNYVRIQGGEITPSVLADNVDDLGSMDVGTAEIMI